MVCGHNQKRVLSLHLWDKKAFLSFLDVSSKKFPFYFYLPLLVVLCGLPNEMWAQKETQKDKSWTWDTQKIPSLAWDANGNPPWQTVVKNKETCAKFREHKVGKEFNFFAFRLKTTAELSGLAQSDKHPHQLIGTVSAEVVLDTVYIYNYKGQNELEFQRIYDTLYHHIDSVSGLLSAIFRGENVYERIPQSEYPKMYDMAYEWKNSNYIKSQDPSNKYFHDYYTNDRSELKIRVHRDNEEEFRKSFKTFAKDFLNAFRDESKNYSKAQGLTSFSNCYVHNLWAANLECNESIEPLTEICLEEEKKWTTADGKCIRQKNQNATVKHSYLRPSMSKVDKMAFWGDWSKADKRNENGNWSEKKAWDNRKAWSSVYINYVMKKAGINAKNNFSGGLRHIRHIAYAIYMHCDTTAKSGEDEVCNTVKDVEEKYNLYTPSSRSLYVGDIICMNRRKKNKTITSWTLSQIIEKVENDLCQNCKKKKFAPLTGNCHTDVVIGFTQIGEESFAITSGGNVGAVKGNMARGMGNTVNKKFWLIDEERKLKGEVYGGDLEGNLDVNLYHFKKIDKHLNIDTKIRKEKRVVNGVFAIMSKEGP